MIRIIRNAGVISLSFAVLALLLISGSAIAKEGTTLKIRYSHQFPVNHTLAKAVDLFAKKVHERTNNRVQIEIYPSSQLYKDKFVAQAVMKGEVEMAMNSTVRWTGIDKIAGATQIPFLVPSNELGRIVINGKWGKAMDDIMKRHGVKLINWMEYGNILGITSNKRPLIKVPDDFKGLKIRSTGKINSRMMKLLGAEPLAMSGSEVYMALQRGTIDGGYSGLTSFVKRKYYEVQKYATLTNLIFPLFMNIINKEFWNKLPSDIREVIQKTGNEIEKWIQVEIGKELEEDMVILNKKMTVHVLTPEEKRSWAKATHPLIQEFIEESGPKGKEIIDWILAERKKLERM